MQQLWKEILQQLQRSLSATAIATSYVTTRPGQKENLSLSTNQFYDDESRRQK